MTHGSLFSGIGGFDLAASWTGWTNVFQCEKDEWCRRVLAKNFPDVKRYTNIKEFNGKEYEGQIDVISGGFPCQPFSVAGNQLSEEDDRYLWPEMFRVIREVKPIFVVCENVPGIIKLALDTVLSDLENEGYTAETFIIPACAKNAWHRRDRVWIIAYTNSIRCHHAEEKNGQSVYDEIRNSEIEEQSRRQQQFRISESSSVSTETDKLNGHIPRFCPGEIPQLKSSGILKDITTNTNGERFKKYWQPGTVSEEHLTPRCDSWWETEPGMGRVVDGLSHRVDRIRGLGNSIVPQIAYEIFKAINIIYEEKY